MAFTAPGLYSRVRTMLPEMLKFLARRRPWHRDRPWRRGRAARQVPRRAAGGQGDLVTLATAVHLPGFPVLDVQGAGEPVGAARGRAVLRAQRGGPAHRGGRGRPGHVRHGAARLARVQRGVLHRHRARHDLPVLRVPQVGLPRPRRPRPGRTRCPIRPRSPTTRRGSSTPRSSSAEATAAPAPLAAPTYSSPWGPQPTAAREQAPAPSGWAAPAPQPAAFPAPAQTARGQRPRQLARR